MNDVIELPDIGLHVSSIEATQGVFWFPNREYLLRWNSTFAIGETPSISFFAGPLSVNLKIVVGVKSLESIDVTGPIFIHLPSTGLSDKILSDWVINHERKDLFFLYILDNKDLGAYINEVPMIHALWDSLRDEYQYAPFIGIGTDKLTVERLKNWLSYCLAWICLSPICESTEKELINSHQNIAAFVKLRPAMNITKLIDLISLLQFRNKADTLLHKFRANKDFYALALPSLSTAQENLDVIPSTQYEKVQKEIYNITNMHNFGDELVPVSIVKLNERLQRFAHVLQMSGIPDLVSIANSIKMMTDLQPPILALLGSYSSGKTTLLNNLLMKKGTPKAFRTSTVANTSIISEIRSAKPGDREKVQFHLRENVTLVIVDRNVGSSTFIGRNTRILLRMMDQGTLIQPTVEIQTWSRTSDENEHRIHKVVTDMGEIAALLNLDRSARRNIEKMIFRAKVVTQRAYEFIPTLIDLSAEGGWHLFQGDPIYTKAPLIENPDASILVKKAEVWLQHMLLNFTSIADTPGTGSMNDMHDDITGQYLGIAEGFILLLPSKNTDSQRVRDLIDRIAATLNQRFHDPKRSGLNAIAYVVNCFADQEKETILDSIRHFQRDIMNAMGFTDDEWKLHQSNADQQNFFVVQLKHLERGANPKSLYGYPSLIPLRKWIKRLFKSSGYLYRYNLIHEVLKVEWNEKHQILANKIIQLGREKKDRLRKATEIEQFRKDELPILTQMHLELIINFRILMDEGRNSLRLQVDKILDEFYEHATEYDDPDEIGDLLRALVREKLNKAITEFIEGDPVMAWIAHIKMKLQDLQVTAPTILPPDPGNQENPWRSDRRFELWLWERKLIEITEKWPKNFFQKFWQDIWGLINQDIRSSLAQNIRDSFWPAQYKSLWTDSLGPYLKRCEISIFQGQAAVQTACIVREKELQSENLDEQRLILENYIKQMDDLSEERRILLELLQDELFHN